MFNKKPNSMKQFIIREAIDAKGNFHRIYHISHYDYDSYSYIVNDKNGNRISEEKSLNLKDIKITLDNELKRIDLSHIEYLKKIDERSLIRKYVELKSDYFAQTYITVEMQRRYNTTYFLEVLDKAKKLAL